MGAVYFTHSTTARQEIRHNRRNESYHHDCNGSKLKCHSSRRHHRCHDHDHHHHLHSHRVNHQRGDDHRYHHCDQGHHHHHGGTNHDNHQCGNHHPHGDCGGHSGKTYGPARNPAPGLKEIAGAIELTKSRLEKLEKTEKKDEIRIRLKQRLGELGKLKGLVKRGEIQFAGFKGWSKQLPADRRTDFRGHSQYDSYFVWENDHKIEVPLTSRIRVAKGCEIDLVKAEVVHSDHSHLSWQSQSLVDLKLNSKDLALGQGDEGCLGCLTGFDADEVAVGLKAAVTNSKVDESPEIVADFSSSAHWIIYSVVALPLALIGLAATARNTYGGTWRNWRRLGKIYRGVMEDLKSCDGDSRAKRVKEAFRKTLGYSLGDTIFNFSIPGVLNGLACLFVVAAVAVELPVAVGLITVYAVVQLGRNIWDLQRNLRFQVAEVTATDTPMAKKGKEKTQRIRNGKSRFLGLFNIPSFALFSGTGVVVTLAVPVIGLLVLAPPALIAVVVLLGVAAIGSGLSNNIGVRKYITPRNGFLGLHRAQLDENSAYEHIGRIATAKSALKVLLSEVRAGDMSRFLKIRRWMIILRTGLPETKDLPVPAAYVRWWHRWFFWLPKTGSGANQRLHEFDQQVIEYHHKQLGKSWSLQVTRVEQLYAMMDRKLSPAEKDSLRCNSTTDDLLTTSWKLLEAAGFAGEVIIQLETLLQDQGCHHDCGLGDLVAIPGLSDDGSRWAQFNFSHFMRVATPEQKRQLNVAMDLYLSSSYLAQLRYQQYGTFDWLQALSKTPLEEENTEAS